MSVGGLDPAAHWQAHGADCALTLLDELPAQRVQDDQPSWVLRTLLEGPSAQASRGSGSLTAVGTEPDRTADMDERERAADERERRQDVREVGQDARGTRMNDARAAQLARSRDGVASTRQAVELSKHLLREAHEALDRSAERMRRQVQQQERVEVRAAREQALIDQEIAASSDAAPEP